MLNINKICNNLSLKFYILLHSILFINFTSFRRIISFLFPHFANIYYHYAVNAKSLHFTILISLFSSAFFHGLRFPWNQFIKRFILLRHEIRNTANELFRVGNAAMGMKIKETRIPPRNCVSNFLF